METYILILTLMFEVVGGAGGGVEHIEVVGWKNCNRIGRVWVKEVNTRPILRPATFVCVKKYNRGTNR